MKNPSWVFRAFACVVNECPWHMYDKGIDSLRFLCDSADAVNAIRLHTRLDTFLSHLKADADEEELGDNMQSPRDFAIQLIQTELTTDQVLQHPFFAPAASELW